MQNFDIITIVGPTACGKTSLAVALAAELNTEIISGDSRQVYRRMDLGTGKDLSEYQYEGRTIPYHLIDICEPGTQYNLFEYQHDFHKAYQDIRSRKLVPILCGGSGLYVESVLKGFRLLDVPANPELRQSLKGKSLEELADILRTYKTLHNTTEIDSCARAIRAIEIEVYNQAHTSHENEFPPLQSLTLGLDIDREIRRARITKRLKERLDQGMLDEVKQLLESGIPAENLIYYGLEYKFLTQHLTGVISYNDMFHGLETAIHQFAKRQMTWLRGMEKRGIAIHWLDAMAPREQLVDEILTLLHQQL